VGSCLWFVGEFECSDVVLVVNVSFFFFHDILCSMLLPDMYVLPALPPSPPALLSLLYFFLLSSQDPLSSLLALLPPQLPFISLHYIPLEDALKVTTYICTVNAPPRIFFFHSISKSSKSFLFAMSSLTIWPRL